MTPTHVTRQGRVWPVLALTAALVGLISLLGMVSGPGWAPPEAFEYSTQDAPDPAITGPTGQPVDREPVGAYQVLRTELRIDLGPTDVPAWLFEPVGAPPGPGVVFLHGAGTVDPDAFGEQVRGLASTGIRTLVPAKRTDTYSTRHRDYPRMAEDYLISWHTLREQVGVDPDRVGIYGESEGAWIAPIAAVAQPEVDFVVLASAPVVSPRQQAAYAMTNYLHNTGVPAGIFRSVPRALGATIPGGGFEYIDFDVRPYYRDLHQPVLMLYGTEDASMPMVQGEMITRQMLEAGGNTAVTTRYVPGADHGLARDGELAPEVVEILADWVWGLPDTSHPLAPTAGPTIAQRYLATDVPAPRWYASGDFLVYGALAVVALAVAGVLAVGAGVYRHRTFPLAVRLSVAMVLGAFTTVTFFLAYIAHVAELALSYATNDLIVKGGWALIQVAGLATVAIGALSVRELHLTGGARRLGPVGRAGIWGCHASALMMLIVAAYWGMFPLRW